MFTFLILVVYIQRVRLSGDTMVVSEVIVTSRCLPWEKPFDSRLQRHNRPKQNPEHCKRLRMHPRNKIFYSLLGPIVAAETMRLWGKANRLLLTGPTQSRVCMCVCANPYTRRRVVGARRVKREGNLENETLSCCERETTGTDRFYFLSPNKILCLGWEIMISLMILWTQLRDCGGGNRLD